MYRIAIHVEGQTEERFVNSVLTPYFQSYKIYLTPIIVFTSKDKTGKRHKGGMTKGSYQSRIKKELIRLMNNFDFVTTLYDFYALPNDFPGYDVTETRTDIQIKNINDALSNDINSSKFIPFLIKHEFESLLFVDPKVATIIDKDLAKGLREILEKFNNLPEDINNNRETSPSHRIISLYPKYEKVNHGNQIAGAIGIETMLKSCPHFFEWVQKLSSLK